ncbi:MAG: M23 family metallopeptidase [Acidobacteriia bacterium]|nr:M23 family metallopeptidase [Terriglobia bacterium]
MQTRLTGRAYRAVVFLAAVTLSGQAPEAPVEARIPAPPAPVRCNGETVLVYELHLTNFRPRDITLNRIEVFGQGSNGAAPVSIYQDRKLADAMVHPGAAAAVADPRKIAGGMRAVAYLWLAFRDASTVPRALRHKLYFTAVGADGKNDDRSLEISNLPVLQTTPVAIAPPVKGGVWIAGNGPSNGSEHRRALAVLGGQALVAQRFAIDWLKLDEGYKGFRGAPKDNRNWYGYGVEVVAVADAMVASVHDGVPENTPLAESRAVPITEETIGGNTVILSLGSGHFAMYAHLQPGSLRVKPGERVRRGQVLGLLGNSGNSDAPHLHFQITDRNSVRGAEGLPFVFDSFELLGTADANEILEKGWTPPAKPVRRQREIPAENAVVRFE